MGGSQLPFGARCWSACSTRGPLVAGSGVLPGGRRAARRGLGRGYSDSSRQPQQLCRAQSSPPPAVSRRSGARAAVARQPYA
eukprot:12942248-Alexandrium_andersonii.AAC.1